MIFRKINRIMQQKPAIFTLIYKAGNKYAGGERHEKKDHHLRIEDVEKIELIVQPSDENERYKLLSQEEMDIAVKLINKSHGKYVEEPEPVTGLSRQLIVTMTDGSRSL